MSFIHLLIIIALFMVVGLVWVIVRQWRVFMALKDEQHRLKEAHADSAREQHAYLLESILVIAQGIKERQCPYSEGCLRLKVLLDNLKPQLHSHDKLSVIHNVYDAIQHIPTLEAWQALSKSERKHFRREMAQIEQMHAESIDEAVVFILSPSFRALSAT